MTAPTAAGRPRPDEPGPHPAAPSPAGPQLSAIRDFLASHVSGIGTILNGVFMIRTHEQAEHLSAMLACQCPDPMRAAAGIWELVSNAIEHGNLAISYDDKTDLLKAGSFAAEIARRQAAEPFVARQVRVEFERGDAAVVLTITDEGDGFDHHLYLDCDATGDRPNGRGLYVASHYAFDDLTFLGKGNCVRAIMRG
ncbi:MAG: ATP-binding protein [Ancalomicrobiaceae bacterium]|nr:ATP-binding protein [Ancalomicrobiaceae bacterium]